MASHMLFSHLEEHPLPSPRILFLIFHITALSAILEGALRTFGQTELPA